MSIRFEGARVILRDEVVETDVTVAAGKIVAVGTAAPADQQIDARGLTLAPALIDVHGDAFERQVMPRPKVFFPLHAALLETDRQLAGNGIATAYHALTLSWEPGLRSVQQGVAFVEALSHLRSRMSVENRIQLRWETFAFEAVELIEKVLAGDLTPSLAFNDHTSMMIRAFDVPVQKRVFEQSPDFRIGDPKDPRMLGRVAGAARRAGLSPEDYLEALMGIWSVAMRSMKPCKPSPPRRAQSVRRCSAMTTPSLRRGPTIVVSGPRSRSFR